MISVIICHRDRQRLDTITASIADTIGVPYELIVIDNTNGQRGIAAAYNEGVRRSHHDILCFTHEDVIFFSKDWGRRAIEHFANPAVGMIGVTGGKAQSSVPSPWWYNEPLGTAAVNLLMQGRASQGDDPAQRYHCLHHPRQGKTEEVVILDGLWFCIRRALFDMIRFDEETFTGFHLYDADISLQVRQHAAIHVVYDILVQHLFSGTITPDYDEALTAFTRKWQDRLPQQTSDMPPSYATTYGWYALRFRLLDLMGRGCRGSAIRTCERTFRRSLPPLGALRQGALYFTLSRLVGYRVAHALLTGVEHALGMTHKVGYQRIPYRPDETAP